jgi:hypothetical protein
LSLEAVQHAVEQPPGDQRHEGSGNAVSGAIADHDRIAVLDRLEPEEIPAYDVARLPDQEMVGGHLVELTAGG